MTLENERIIYLYHKISPRGLNYLGSTTNINPLKYKGSGIYWRNHLKKHKIESHEVKTVILFKTFDKKALREAGLYYSTLYNVVESKLWANLIPETGDGVLKAKLTEEHKRKISDAGKGRVISPETREKLRKAHLGKKHRKETKLKLSLAKKGKNGPKHSEKTRKKISELKAGKSKPGVHIVNILTGEKFPSVREAALKFKIKEQVISRKLRERNPDFEFQYENKDHQTYKRPSGYKREFSEEAKMNMKINSGQAKKIKNKETGEVFNSLVDAAASIGMKANSLSAQLKHKRKCEFEYAI